MSLWDIVGIVIVGVIAYFALQSGVLNNIMSGITGGLGGGGGAMGILAPPAAAIPGLGVGSKTF